MVSWVNLLLGGLPFVFILIGKRLERRGIPGWGLRKYYHIVLYGLLGIYAVIHPTLQSMGYSLGTFVLLNVVFTLFTSYDINTVIRSGVRDGESPMTLQVNNALTLFFIILILIFFQRWVFVLSSFVLAFGDGMGEVMGRPFGRVTFHVFNRKSILGSLAVMAGSGASLLFVNTHYALGISIPVIFAYAVGFTVLEMVAYSFTDNLFIQLASVGIYYLQTYV